MVVRRKTRRLVEAPIRSDLSTHPRTGHIRLTGHTRIPIPKYKNRGMNHGWRSHYTNFFTVWIGTPRVSNTAVDLMGRAGSRGN
jgi:hypothetical protein